MSLEYKELLYQALRSPRGLIVKTDNVRSLKQRLYAARKSDEELKAITLSTSPNDPDGELWLVKKETT